MFQQQYNLFLSLLAVIDHALTLFQVSVRCRSDRMRGRVTQCDCVVRRHASWRLYCRRW
jgi:hypothetical protein